MLPAKYRLCLRKELNRVKKNSHLVSAGLFSILIAKQDINHPTSRFAFIVSKKIHKKAVERNRIKRLLSESIWSLIKKINPGFDCLFLVKRAIIGQNLIMIRKEVRKILSHEKIYSSFD